MIPEVDFGVAVEGAPIEEGQEDRERFPTDNINVINVILYVLLNVIMM